MDDARRAGRVVSLRRYSARRRVRTAAPAGVAVWASAGPLPHASARLRRALAATYGAWRAVVGEVADTFLACGVLDHGLPASGATLARTSTWSPSRAKAATSAELPRQAHRPLDALARGTLLAPVPHGRWCSRSRSACTPGVSIAARSSATWRAWRPGPSLRPSAALQDRSEELPTLVVPPSVMKRRDFDRTRRCKWRCRCFGLAEKRSASNTPDSVPARELFPQSKRSGCGRNSVSHAKSHVVVTDAAPAC